MTLGYRGEVQLVDNKICSRLRRQLRRVFSVDICHSYGTVRSVRYDFAFRSCFPRHRIVFPKNNLSKNNQNLTIVVQPLNKIVRFGTSFRNENSLFNSKIFIFHSFFIFSSEKVLSLLEDEKTACLNYTHLMVLLYNYLTITSFSSRNEFCRAGFVLFFKTSVSSLKIYLYSFFHVF